MPYDNAIFKPLALLANAFENSGEYHKSINIYLYLIKHTNNQVDKSDLMERLGRTYLRAGFLERARSIFSEILHKQPRKPKILYELGVVYEMMREYDKAQEVIEPLQTLGEDTSEFEKFLEFEKISSDKSIEPKEKIELLSRLVDEEPALYRPILTLFFRLDTQRAWSLIVAQDLLHSVLDILWFLPYSQLNLDIISLDKRLKSIYYAKGYLSDKVEQSGIFAIDMLVSSRRSGFEDGDLTFSYLCKKCKQSFPLSFTRCPNCLAINTIEVEESISHKSSHTDYSLL
jgi:tetratricopeptide (TPR) repeat protein